MSTHSQICMNRLTEERKLWRKEHPFGFWAKPEKKADGTLDLTKWTAGVPGKAGTDWEGGLFKLKLVFPINYPAKPPVVSFTPPLFHPNVYDNGNICLSIINDYQDWKPSITLKQILIGVQDLLDTPNKDSPANGAANKLFTKDLAGYKKKVKAIAAANKPVDE